ncbi:MAG TPA: mechanosensitive ion channel domain-containing protein [Candidatus Saccharimonadaceae bacterium]|nr:mechanosensitive ion channel domain-containing protein [Candidatus Saccharimonadaceae bacterium]
MLTLPVLTDKHIVTIAIIILVAVLVYIVGASAIGSLIKHIVGRAHRSLRKRDLEKRKNTLADLFMTLWRIAVIVATIIVLASIIFPHINYAPLFASAGIVGVAVGFGSQALVKDFLSGLFIISDNQYRIGDVIDINGSSGTVERIGARSTVLRDDDGNVHYFPNGTITHVINKTMGYGVAKLTVSIAPEVGSDVVVKIIDATGRELAKAERWSSRITEAPHFVKITDFSPTTVNLLVCGQTQAADQWAVASEMRSRLYEEFRKQKIDATIPAES